VTIAESIFSLTKSFFVLFLGQLISYFRSILGQLSGILGQFSMLDAIKNQTRKTQKNVDFIRFFNIIGV